MKKVMSRQTLLIYPNFSQPFHIFADGSKVQLGAVIMQNGKPVAFYSRKLTPAQINYTTSERELLSIVETLKEFRSILLGQNLVIHTDHLNLTFKNSNTECISHWKLLLEEYGPQIEYVEGEKNIVADALSRLLKLEDNVVPSHSMAEFQELYGMDEADLPETAFPLTFTNLAHMQNAQNDLFTELNHPNT